MRMRTVGSHEPFLSYNVASGNVFVDKEKSKF